MEGVRVMMDPLAATGLALFTGGLFVAAGVHKWRDRTGFQQTLAAYNVAPPVLMRPLSLMVPAVEILAGLGVVWPVSRPGAALVLAGLLVVYAGAIGVNLLRGRVDIDCGCFMRGQGSAQGSRLGLWLLGRNAVLILFCLALVLPVAARDLTWMDWLPGLGTAVLIALLYGTVEQLAANGVRISTLRGGHA